MVCTTRPAWGGRADGDLCAPLTGRGISGGGRDVLPVYSCPAGRFRTWEQGSGRGVATSQRTLGFRGSCHPIGQCRVQERTVVHRHWRVIVDRAATKSDRLSSERKRRRAGRLAGAGMTRRAAETVSAVGLPKALATPAAPTVRRISLAAFRAAAPGTEHERSAAAKAGPRTETRRW